jgi:hypothetical protein
MLSVLLSDSTLTDLSIVCCLTLSSFPFSNCWNCSTVFSTVGDELSDDDDFERRTRSVGPMFSADFLKSLLEAFGDAIFGESAFVGDCGGSDFPLSGVFDIESRTRSFATEILDGDGEAAIDELRLVSVFTGEPSLLLGSEKLNLSDF